MTKLCSFEDKKILKKHEVICHDLRCFKKKKKKKVKYL